MLSGETASGSYPVEAVSMMDSIVREAESHMAEWGICKTQPEEFNHNDALSTTRAATELARDRDVEAIAVFTQTGITALYLSKMRPRVPILAFTPEIETYRRLSMMWGVKPYIVPFASTVETMLKDVEQAIVESTNLKSGQQIVLVTGYPVGEMRPPNLALLYTLT